MIKSSEIETRRLMRGCGAAARVQLSATCAVAESALQSAGLATRQAASIAKREIWERLYGDIRRDLIGLQGKIVRALSFDSPSLEELSEIDAIFDSLISKLHFADSSTND